jgi:hypothetical protein
LSVRKTVLKAKDVARRLRGLSALGFGASWDYPPSERETIRKLILFLEDRRALFNLLPAEVEDHVIASVASIRERCTEALGEMGEHAKAAVCIRIIRAACRRFLDEPYPSFANVEESPPDRTFSERQMSGNLRRGTRPAGFFTALGELRASIGQQIAILAASYGLDVEGNLVSIIPPST